jgi:hypothetical protein
MSEIDLQKFCEMRKARSAYAAPWTLGDRTYALDGRFAVRVPRIHLEGIVDTVDKDSIEVAAKIAEALAEHAGARATATPIPAIPDFEKETCVTCHGRKLVVMCEECDGEGSQTCNLDHEHECETCDSFGYVGGLIPEMADAVGCWKCLGEGFTPASSFRSWGMPVVLLPQMHCLSLLNLKRLRMLPECVWHWPEFAAETPDKAIPFWFKDGDGIFLPASSPGLGRPGTLYIGQQAEAVA